MFVGVSCRGELWGLDVFRAAEELGFDGLFTGEHLLAHRPTWDAITMTTALACATERITIGPAAVIAPLRHPTLLAKELAGIDRISGGRLVVALGVGGDYPEEFTQAGVPFERRGQRTDETIEILRRYFSGERFSYEGELYRLEDVRLDPPPARPGGPPLWVAGRSEAARRRAGRLGDGFLPYMVTPASCRLLFDSTLAHAGQAGRGLPSGYAWGAYVHVSLGDDPDEARRRGDEHLAWRYADPRLAGELAGRYCVAGCADDVVEGLLGFAEVGCTHLVLALIAPEGTPALEPLRAVAETVLPRVRRGRRGG
ncbi:MAG: LLM class flavin-dependent oxidoreductase [Thermoleophilia bacterium]|nr:LLM class flavin-dependent oxidoreductase [Thermoleophilia bacterium]